MKTLALDLIPVMVRPLWYIALLRRVSIRSTAKTLNNFPHVWIVGIGHYVLEKIFLTFCLGLVDRLGSFTTSVYPFLVILMDGSTEAILSENFGFYLWSHPKFRSLAGFKFYYVSRCGRDEDVIEARNSKR